MAHIYHFDDVEIDLGNFRVLKAGVVLPIEPKSLNVLVYLVENRGRLIEKRELLDAVWGEAFVTENVLTRSIGQLRKVLDDDAKDASYIETVPTKGYRFVPEVTVEGNGDAPAGPSGGPETANPAIGTTSGRTDQSRNRYAVLAVAVAAVACALIGVALYSFWGRTPAGSMHLGAGTQVTTSAGISFYPTLSPDGTRIAYSSDRGKGFEIFVRQLAPGGQEEQITSDGGENYAPAWSPDGSLITYSSRQRGGIWLIPAQGGAARKLLDFGARPAWSRDGQWIAFQSGDADVFSADGLAVVPPSTIWVIRPDGSDARQVTRPEISEGAHGAPSWSPDSKHIVFLSGDALWAIAADGTGAVQLAPPAYRYFDPVYSPDGKSVIYGAAAGGKDLYGLLQLPISPITSAPSGKTVQILNVGASVIRNPAFSADGKKLVYAALSVTSGIQSQAISTAGDAEGEPSPLIGSVGCRTYDAAYSPDGSKIAFISCLGLAGGAPAQIWVVNADGSGAQQLTFPPAVGIAPMWYPDNKHVLFIRNDAALFQVDVETRQQKLVADLPGFFDFPTLSPDGSKVALNLTTGGATNVWVMDLATKNRKQLTFDKESIGFPAWSPDGKFIAAEIQRGRDNNIVVFPSEGGPVTEITPIHGQQWLHSWAPDGDKLLFAKLDDDGFWNVWSVSRSTKIQKQLTRYSDRNTFVRYPVMSPHGDRLLYERTESSGNVWMVDLK